MDSSRRYQKISAIVITFIVLWVVYLFMPIVQDPHGVDYYLKPGTSKKVFVEELTAQGIIHFPWAYSLFILPQYKAQLKTGEYHFKKGASPYSIWQQVISGKGLKYRPFTIIPGWSFRQLKNELLKAVGLKHLTAKLEDKQIMQFMGDGIVTPEGRFYPDTYYYTRGISDLVILKQAYDLMQLRLDQSWRNRSNNLPFKTPYEALIAASLIEKEAFLNKERPIIAGVLINRLKRGMLLQFDPTVIYGLGERYQGKIRKEHLVQDTPYNTYLHKGLPPTPISMPSYESIQAALHPAKNDYLYFVAKGDGSHQFSNTLLEHHVAVTNASTTSIKKQEPSVNERFIHDYLHPRDTLKSQIHVPTIRP